MSTGAPEGIRLSPRAGTPDPKDIEETSAEEAAEDSGAENEKDKEMKDKDDKDMAASNEAAAQAAAKEAQASERARVAAVAKAVAEDDACKGKADLALSMLADDDFASLSADGIVKILGKQSPAKAEDSSLGKQMLDQAREGGQADVGNDSSDGPAAEGNPLLSIANDLRKAQS